MLPEFGLFFGILAGFVLIAPFVWVYSILLRTIRRNDERDNDASN